MVHADDDRLVRELLVELKLRPVRQSDSLTGLAEWIREEFGTESRDDPRVAELVEIANAWLDHHRGEGA